MADAQPSHAKKKEKPFGSWKSTITAGFATGDTCRRICQVELDKSELEGSGRLYWLEELTDRSRGVVYEMDLRASPEDCKQIEWTPYPFSCRNAVHAFGGASFIVHEGKVWFETASNIFQQDAYNHIPEPIAELDQGFRFADAVRAYGSLYCVREDHSGRLRGESKEALNALVRLKPDHASVIKDEKDYHRYVYPEMEVIQEGADFYSSPRISGDGSKLAWAQWNHPNMPWEATEIWTADLDADGNLMKASARKVLGDGKSNFTEPRWSPWNKLYCISDVSDWWNIYEVDMEARKLGDNVLMIEAEIGFPQWQFGGKSYDFDQNLNNQERIVFSTGKDVFVRDLKSAETRRLETGYTGHAQLCVDSEGALICIATHPKKPQALIRVDIGTGEVEVVREVRDTDEFRLEDVSAPEEIEFTHLTPSDSPIQVSALFYPAKNAFFRGPEGCLPPLIVLAHDGPTAQATDALDFDKQFFTSKGFALCEVNYRGSSGRGRAWRDQLRAQAGVADVEDLHAAALHLSGAGRVDPEKICLLGQSYGGFLVLESLRNQDVFKAGAIQCGIFDLEKHHLASHKFSSHYFESLVGPHPAQAEKFRKRSPLRHPKDVSAAVALFHGAADKTAPVEQAEKLHEALKKKGVCTTLVVFEGEGHRLGKMANVAFGLNGAYYFFCAVLGIEAAIDPPDMELMFIENLKQRVAKKA